MLYAIRNLKRHKEDTELTAEKISIRVAGILTFIGVFLFVMLFEGRARYLFNSIIVFTTMAVIGYSELIDDVGFEKVISRRKKEEIKSK